MTRAGLILLAIVMFAAAGAPLLTPHGPGDRFHNSVHAPPMPVHVRDGGGHWHWPFVYPVRLADRLESRYEEDRTRRVGLVWFSRGAIVAAADERSGPWLPLGADSFGRDVFARLLYGARLSLGVALVSVVGALLAGILAGGVAGYFGGALDEGLMRLAEFILVLPTVYAVLALRAVMPLVLSSTQVFGLMVGIFALVGWPYVARGVRGIVAVERGREYAEAARAAGAGHARILVRHLLPAAAGHLGTQATLLVPAFILAEATLSYVGLGFADPTPTWGTMLSEVASVSRLAQFPWMLAPAAGIFLVVLAVNLVVQGTGGLPVSTPGERASGNRVSRRIS
jgi:peptide/nickel transport system permease protein